jgi:hypothetical protein
MLLTFRRVFFYSGELRFRMLMYCTFNAKKSITTRLNITVHAIEGRCVKGGAEGFLLWPFGLHQNCTYFHRKWLVR